MMFLVTGGMIRAGIVPSILFPKSDNNNLQATIAFPDGTTAEETDNATRKMLTALNTVSKRIASDRSKKTGIPIEEIYNSEVEGQGTGPVRLTYRDVGTISNLQNAAGGGIRVTAA